ncbi:uncharacterized protein F5147DRAFT_725773 [Suillus discolor]|uniref:Uncharacterized protein n=1 Tax=Suillus discolor TaxID=1912936 RepID=A0A9P7EUS5_9AGAM|nr:uncharacterized protein F5147DRAFT_725773 [Suillus discolor]KAG2089431.1 hypothetical protein F5147DRAFT_725773 [Suillus discolor]
MFGRLNIWCCANRLSLIISLSMVDNVLTISLTDTVSWMMYTILWDWTGAVVFAMLWGELCTCETSKDPDISRCHLPGNQHFCWSDSRNVNDAYFRRYT